MNCDKPDSNCICAVLTVICLLQNNKYDEDFIGNCNQRTLENFEKNKYNTRPVIIYNCYGNPWVMPVDINNFNNSRKSFVFRIEKINECCATFRVLDEIEDSNTKTKKFIATETFFTIDLKCICAISCLEDIFIECI